MSSPAGLTRSQVRAAALESIRRLIDLLMEDAPTEAPGPRLVTAQEDVLLTIDEAAALLKVEKSTIHRLVKRYPRIKRYVGARIRYERGELLRATRRG